MVVRKRKRRRKKHYHTGVYVSTKTGQHCKYRSGWELAHMKYLDDNEDVFTWSYESVAIPYVSNLKTGKLRKYFPDFLVEFKNGSKQLVEIKPKKRVLQVKVQKKLKAAETWCREHGIALVVLTEHELRDMGLL